MKREDYNDFMPPEMRKEGKKKKVDLKRLNIRYICAAALLLIIWGLFSAGVFDGAVKAFRTAFLIKAGNTGGNIKNGGFAAGGKDVVYYTGIGESIGIYKIEEKNKQVEKICSDAASHLNISGEWVYYINLSDEGRIYRVREDGSSRMKITEDSAAQMYISNKSIYYINISDESKLYMIDMDGSDETVVVETQTRAFALAEDYIYYINASKGYGLYRSNLDGKREIEIIDSEISSVFIEDEDIYFTYFDTGDMVFKIRTDDTEPFAINLGQLGFNINGEFGYSVSGTDSIRAVNLKDASQEKIYKCKGIRGNLNLVGNWIYYFDYNDMLHRMNRDGSSDEILKTEVKSDPAKTVEEAARPVFQCSNQGYIQLQEGMGIQGDWIYYAEKAPIMNLYRIGRDGSGKSRLGIVNAENLRIYGEYIYYTRAVDKRLCRARMDGTQDMLFLNINVNFYEIADDWIYYVDQNDRNIYKICMNGSNKTKIANQYTRTLIIAGEWIYYNDLKGNIYKVSRDGKNNSMIAKCSSLFFSVEGDYIYYIDNLKGMNLFKVRNNGKENTLLSSEGVVDYISSGDYIYARITRGLNTYSIYRIRKDGKEEKVLVESSAWVMGKNDDWIYYFDNKAGCINKINIDGSGKSKIVDGTAAYINISDGWIYYRSVNNAINRFNEGGKGKERLE